MIQPAVVPLAALGVIPLALIALRNNRDTFRIEQALTADERERWQVQEIVTGRRTAAEVRVFGLGAP